MNFQDLLLQKQWVNFNQTWHKASLGEGDSSLFNEGPRPFPMGDNYEIAKNTLKFKKSFLLGQFQPYFGKKHPWVKRI